MLILFYLTWILFDCAYLAAFAKASEKVKQLYFVPQSHNQVPTEYSTLVAVRGPLVEVNARIIRVMTANIYPAYFSC